MQLNISIFWQAIKTIIFGSMLAGALLLSTGCNNKQSGLEAAEAEKAVTSQKTVASSDLSLEEIKANINATWAAARPGVVIQSVEETEVAGIYKVSAGAGPPLYSTADGANFFTGDLYRLGPNKITNVTEEAKNGDRAKAVAALQPKDLISFSPKGATKSSIYVFTDVDCYYCQKLHANIAKMNELGIAVHYLAYPRAGIGSASYNKVVSAWCAEDKHDAITKLKARQSIANKVCDDNPVVKQFQLGQTLGLTGTPALITDKGELIAGYMDPAPLAQRLGL